MANKCDFFVPGKRCRQSLMRRLLLRCIVGGLWLFPVALFSASFPNQNRQAASVAIVRQDTLDVGMRLDKSLAKNTVHEYILTLNANNYIHIVVQKIDLDIGLTLLDSKADTLVRKDSDQAHFGKEWLRFHTKEPGTYRLQVKAISTGDEIGRYTLWVKALRPASSSDLQILEADKYLADATRLYATQDKKNMAAAIGKCDKAIELFLAAGDSLSAEETYGVLGQVYYSLGRYREALPAFERFLISQRAVGDSTGIATALYNLSMANLMTGKRQEALKLLEQVTSLRETLGDYAGLANVYLGLAFTYRDQGDIQKAKEAYGTALEFAQQANDDEKRARILGGIGMLYHRTGELRKALEVYEEAMGIFRKLNRRSGMANMLNNLAGIYDDIGEKQKALDYYREALQICREIGERYGEAHILNGIGTIYYDYGELQRALEYYDKSLALRKQLGDPVSMANSYHNIGMLYQKNREYAKALKNLEKSLELCRQYNYRYGIASNLSAIGYIHLTLGENEQALDYFEQAMTIQTAIRNASGLAYLYNNMAGAYENLGQHEKAFELVEKAADLFQRVGEWSGEAASFYNLARFEMRAGRLEKAIGHIERTLYLVESQRSNVLIPALRDSYFADAQPYYELYVDLLMALHAAEPEQGYLARALEANESARARGLLDLLAESRIEIKQGVDQELLEQERQLQETLNNLQKQLYRGKRARLPDEKMAEIEGRIHELITRYDELQMVIRQKAPRYAALANPRPLTVQQIRERVLDDQTALLEYHLGKERSYLWLVTLDRLQAFELPARDSLEVKARTLYELLTARNRGEAKESFRDKQARITRAEQESERLLHELGEILLGPALPLPPVKRLLIVAGGALQYLPFAALPVRDTTAGREDNSAARLIENYELVSLPSASVLAEIRQGKQDKPASDGLLAVIADPVFSANDPRVRKKMLAAKTGQDPQLASDAGASLEIQLATRAIDDAGIARSGLDVPRLIFSRLEAEEILALVPDEHKLAALDFEANYQTATSPEFCSHQILHFATHGILNSRHPELSGILLSLVDEEGSPRKGFLPLHEIYNLDLSANLVVLSACQTALGREIRGEGLVGLTRGFMYAGAEAVVASLWKVDDEATAELMKRFYRYLLGEEKMSVAAGLQRAQQSLLQHPRWRSPYYWAGFILQGDWE